MEKLFINIFHMSSSASYLILAVLLVRFLLRKAPKSMRSFLWLLVGIRLVVPFSVESIFSLIPNTQMAENYIYQTVQPDINLTMLEKSNQIIHQFHMKIRLCKRITNINRLLEWKYGLDFGLAV